MSEKTFEELMDAYKMAILAHGDEQAARDVVLRRFGELAVKHGTNYILRFNLKSYEATLDEVCKAASIYLNSGSVTNRRALREVIDRATVFQNTVTLVSPIQNIEAALGSGSWMNISLVFNSDGDGNPTIDYMIINEVGEVLGNGSNIPNFERLIHELDLYFAGNCDRLAKEAQP